MSALAYAVHTGTCTYLLDDDGVCRWTQSPTGQPVPGAERCLGAQFVACLDLSAPGGLVGELRVGAAALFARLEGGRFVLLRTPPLANVEFRRAMAPGEHPIERASQAALRSYASRSAPPAAEPALRSSPPPPYAAPPAHAIQAEESVNVEDLVTYTEVTLTIPLYRPDAQSTPPPPRRSMIGPGRRLR